MDEIFSTPKVQMLRLLDRVSNAPDGWSAPADIMSAMVRWPCWFYAIRKQCLTDGCYMLTSDQWWLHVWLLEAAIIGVALDARCGGYRASS
jgi:hypothetical protein